MKSRKITESDYEGLSEVSQLLLALSYKTGIAPKYLMDLPNEHIYYLAYLMQTEAEASS